VSALIKLLVPCMPHRSELTKYLERIDLNLWYSNFGPLERELRERLEKKYAAHIVTVSSCTAGLELMYRHYRDLGNVSIALPSLTFPATVLAAKREGLWIEFEDVDPLTWTHQAVAGFGLPATGVWVDAAAAFGEQTVPSWMTAVFSLHATKAVGAGEGGFIVTHDKHLADKFRRQTNFGFVDGISHEWGTNAKMSEYACAVALTSLDAWDREPWLRLDGWYRDYLPQSVGQQDRPLGVYPILAVKLPGGCSVSGILVRLINLDIETRRWYWPPMHQHPIMSGQGILPGLPVTDDLSARLLGLPYHLFLTEGDVASTCAELAEAIEKEMNR
jgi:dTDP-4-amino-4,6-dideoxygalactose transaminase